jgi:hypothetical protein
MIRLRALRGKVKTRRGEGKRAMLKSKEWDWCRSFCDSFSSNNGDCRVHLCNWIDFQAASMYLNVSSQNAIVEVLYWHSRHYLWELHYLI